MKRLNRQPHEGTKLPRTLFGDGSVGYAASFCLVTEGDSR